MSIVHHCDCIPYVGCIIASANIDGWLIIDYLQANLRYVTVVNLSWSFQKSVLWLHDDISSQVGFTRQKK